MIKLCFALLWLFVCFIASCVSLVFQINIFNLDKADSVKDIDRAILYALLRGEGFISHTLSLPFSVLFLSETYFFVVFSPPVYKHGSCFFCQVLKSSLWCHLKAVNQKKLWAGGTGIGDLLLGLGRLCGYVIMILATQSVVLCCHDCQLCGLYTFVFFVWFLICPFESEWLNSGWFVAFNHLFLCIF